MTTLNKNGKVTAAARKARFPKYIAYIDCLSHMKDVYPDGLFTKAMKETDMINAVAALSVMARDRHEDIYLVGIYEKTKHVDEQGMPLYEMTIGARMQNDGKLGEWHAWTEENRESPHALSIWISKDFGKDRLEEWSRDGSLHSDVFMTKKIRGEL